MISGAMKPRRTHDQTRTGHMAFVLTHGDAEIDQHRPGRGNHHIGRLDITVDDARLMHGTYRFDELTGETFEIIAHIRAVRGDILLDVFAFRSAP